MSDESGPTSVLTHIVVAVRFPSFGTHERNVRPFAVAVGVALNQVVRRLATSDPVTQKLTDPPGVDDSVSEHRSNILSGSQ